MAAATIPNITALRTALDYGDARLPRCATFYDDMRAFRRKFTTSRGVPGVDLHDWKSREGQAGLSEMTIAYLEKDGGGLMFWPDDSLSPNYNKFQYSKDGYRSVASPLVLLCSCSFVPCYESCSPSGLTALGTE